MQASTFAKQQRDRAGDQPNARCAYMKNQDRCRRAADQPGAPCAYVKNHVGDTAITTAAVIQFPPTQCSRISPRTRPLSSQQAGGWSRSAGDADVYVVSDAAPGFAG